MTACRLRQSTDADHGRLFEIWESAVRATHHFLSPADFDFFARMVRDEYLPSRRFIVAVDHEDRAAGFLGATGNEIEALFVDADHHGRGIGSLLLGDMLRKPGKLFVEVNEQNPGARGFYERLGFRTIDRMPLDATGRPYPILRMERS